MNKQKNCVRYKEQPKLQDAMELFKEEMVKKYTSNVSLQSFFIMGGLVSDFM